MGQGPLANRPRFQARIDRSGKFLIGAADTLVRRIDSDIFHEHERAAGLSSKTLRSKSANVD